MASKTGIGIFSKLLTKTSNRLNETLGILKDKMLSARVIDISLNSNSPLWEQTGEWKGIGTIQFQLVVTTFVKQDQLPLKSLHSLSPMDFPILSMGLILDSK